MIIQLYYMLYKLLYIKIGRIVYINSALLRIIDFSIFYFLLIIFLYNISFSNLIKKKEIIINYKFIIIIINNYLIKVIYL